MSITILYLLHKLTFGGTERVVVNLINNSVRNINNFICSFQDFDDKFLKEISYPEDLAFSLNKKDGNDLSIPFKIASLCKKYHVDIIHSMGWATYGEGLLAAKLLMKKMRFIYSYRGKTIEDTIGVPKRRILAQRFFSKFCDTILTNSEVSKKEYAQEIGIDPTKIGVIHNGVDVDKFTIKTDMDLEQRKRIFGFRKSDIVIGSVARFDPVKNMKALLMAFSELAGRSKESLKLFLVGDGSQLAGMKALASNLGLKEKIRFAGMRGDIHQCLKFMDIYVQPSIFENIPNSILEAMASGLPVVATNVGGIPEIVQDGETGLLVDLDDGRGLVRSIESLIKNQDKRLEMGKKGRERVGKQFSIQKMVSEYEKLYEHVLR